MIEFTIPGCGVVQLEHLLSDVSATLAVDGRLADGVARALLSLRDWLTFRLLTADTHGRQAAIDEQLGLRVVRVSPGDEVRGKAEYVERLDSERIVAAGQGANDAGMLRQAAIVICVLSTEGAAVDALNAADMLAPDIHSALALLENPLRLVASLRR